eukprot:1382037-Amorphochlora_amoeboformis.AAC.2
MEHLLSRCSQSRDSPGFPNVGSLRDRSIAKTPIHNLSPMRKLGRPGVWQAGPMARRGAFFAIAAWVWIAIMLNNCSQGRVLG